jgi:putative Mg2+ transporter-C (MgtC) family protein
VYRLQTLTDYRGKWFSQSYRGGFYPQGSPVVGPIRRLHNQKFGVLECFSMNPIDTIGIQQMILRLSAAALVGAVVGLNRELHGKAAGVRTLALVALGAAVATMITAQPQTGGVVADPNVIGRIIQGIMTGIGFLGAGVILRDGGGHVTGLTTAAAIWVCAALGIVCGLGYWQVVGVSLGLVLLVLLLGRSVELAAERIFKRNRGGPPDHDA